MNRDDARRATEVAKAPAGLYSCIRFTSLSASGDRRPRPRSSLLTLGFVAS
jgi:hypothetical protein